MRIARITADRIGDFAVRPLTGDTTKLRQQPLRVGSARAQLLKAASGLRSCRHGWLISGNVRCSKILNFATRSANGRLEGELVSRLDNRHYPVWIDCAPSLAGRIADRIIRPAVRILIARLSIRQPA